MTPATISQVCHAFQWRDVYERILCGILLLYINMSKLMLDWRHGRIDSGLCLSHAEVHSWHVVRTDHDPNSFFYTHISRRMGSFVCASSSFLPSFNICLGLFDAHMYLRENVGTNEECMTSSWEIAWFGGLIRCSLEDESRLLVACSSSSFLLCQPLGG